MTKIVVADHTLNYNFDFFVISKNKINNLNSHHHSRTGEFRGSFNPNNLLYPVYNSHYQEYRKKYKKGRDMVVWTKPETISMEDMSNEFKTFIVTKSDINSSL